MKVSLFADIEIKVDRSNLCKFTQQLSGMIPEPML